MISLVALSIYLKIEQITIDANKNPVITWQHNFSGVTKLQNDELKLRRTFNFVYLCQLLILDCRKSFASHNSQLISNSNRT